MQINNPPIVTISNVSFTYGNDPAVTDINLEIHHGDFLGLIGPNGSGKTTLLKLILGLLKPQQGSIRLFGQDIHDFRDWSKIGYVPQRAGAEVTKFPISIEEVVGMGGANNKNITDALLEVEMIEQRKDLLKNLSGGQQQRVLIARALAAKPELLILDEPTVGVDADTQTKFYQLLRDLNRHHKLTLILVSHDIDVVAHEVTEVACINYSLICHGHPQDVLKNEYLDKLYGKDIRFVVHGH